jgi:hypothetical protein
MDEKRNKIPEFILLLISISGAGRVEDTMNRNFRRKVNATFNVKRSLSEDTELNNN